MASSSKVAHFHNALDYAYFLKRLSEFNLKEAQYEASKNIAYNSKDTICILSTAFEKLIYQLIPYVFDYFCSK